MTFGSALIFLIGGIAAIYVGMAFLAHRPHYASDTERLSVSAFILVVFSLLLSARMDGFGVDTITYLNIFNEYCFTNIDDLEFSYRVSLGLINLIQIGACNPAWLKVAWVFAIVSCFFLLPDRLSDKIKIGALGLFSLIGTELSTNAMRQGLSAAVVMLAFAWYPRNRIMGFVLAIFAVMLHGSSALVIVAFSISLFKFRYYIVALVVLIILVLSYSYLGVSVTAIDRLTYEIYKYSLHDASELYIRILAAAQLAVPAVVALLMHWRDNSRGNTGKSEITVGLKLALTALPYLTLPYFGYRYIYGIYLIVLYCSRSVTLDDRRSAFEIVLIANALIALAWALGSSFVSQMPFLEL